MSKDSRYRALPDDASLHPPRVGGATTVQLQSAARRKPPPTLCGWSNDCTATERRATQAPTHPVWVEQRLSS